jgi:tRNA U34 5-methylaminomethyl-2-thiouridine-forming methyltransferase MnmC
MKDSLIPNHQVVETQDGSFTLFSERFQESCHSLAGAREETIHQYVKGCEIEKKILEQQELRILEVGFGLGVGFLTTLEFLKDSQHSWRFVSLELDEDLVRWFFKTHFPDAGVSQNENIFSLSERNWTLEIVTGDARKCLPKYLNDLPTTFHAIYQDAFSPKKNPTLWTVEWFDLLKSASSPDAILSTYSSSSSIRKSLDEAGWKLYEGGKFGTKRSSTRARLTGETDPEILLHFQRSPALALKDSHE